MTPEEILKSKKSFAIVGASNEMLKYGYEFVCVFKNYSYKTFPINPKYDEIEGVKFYPSLKDLPEKVDAVITALALKNTVNLVPIMKEIGVAIIWFPDTSIKITEQLKLNHVKNVCPISILRRNN